jgi:hypothetical protein
LSTSAAIGYIALLRRNRSFRRLWYGQLASQLGDWLDSIALYTLLLNLTGSAKSVGALIVAQYLPLTLVGFGAGALVDRWPRKWVLIGTDLGRAFLVLFLLLVRDVEHVWIVYVVVALKECLTGLYEPAREAAIPGVTEPEELIAANGISGITWSMMLAGGAALGGVVVAQLGTHAAFVLDSLSFVASALFTASAVIRELTAHERATVGVLRGLREGFAYLATHGDVAVYALSKALWGLGGGVLVVITLYGKQVFPIDDGALSIGLLYAARGVGAGIGPVLGQRLGGVSITFLRRAIGPGFLLMALGYLGFTYSPNLWLAALCLVLAHVGGSVQWVYSTALLQLTVPHRLLGRVFSVEMALAMLTVSASSFATGELAAAGWTPRALALMCALIFVPSGLLLTCLLWRRVKPAADHAR